MPKRSSVIPVLALAVARCQAQVLINEVFENPPGRGTLETGWEFVELYGRPGLPLDGMALLVLKGGMDEDRDGVPEVWPEIDEVFALDGHRLGPDGLFTLIGSRQDGESPLGDRYFALNPAFNPRLEESATNQRWIGAGSFQSLMASGSGPVSRLDNHGSSTYALVRVLDAPASTIHWLRGVAHDTDFDGQMDPVVATSEGTRPFPVLQTLDEVAWSHRGGREYVLFETHEISECHGLNPDAVARLRYFSTPPDLGDRTRDRKRLDGDGSGFDILRTTAADEGFVYGVLDTPRFPSQLAFFDGFDLDGWPQLKGPTDAAATRYLATARDPEPDMDPFPMPSPRHRDQGLRLQDINLAGFVLTPGRLNDHPSGRIQQFRIVAGDLNFDGLVDASDADIASSLADRTLDEMLEDASSPHGLRPLWNGAVAQQILMLQD